MNAQYTNIEGIDTMTNSIYCEFNNFSNTEK